MHSIHHVTSYVDLTLFSLPRFTTPHHKEGFELFLDTITEMEDVWLVTSWQAIQWMRSAVILILLISCTTISIICRDPTSLDRIRDFKPFNCDYKVITI